MSDYTHTPIGSGYNSNANINTELTSIETSNNSKMDKTGGTFTGDVDLNSSRLLNVADGVNLTDGVNYNQLINSSSFNEADVKFYDTESLWKSDTTTQVGDIVSLKDRNYAYFNIITGTGTANTTSIIAHSALDVSASIIVSSNFLNVKAFGGNVDITSAIQACANALPSEGGTIDARDIVGTQTLTDGIFDNVRKPIKFLGGNTTYETDLSTINHNIHAGTIIEGGGTTFQSDVVNPEPVNGTNSGYFTTMVDNTTGSITSGSRTITVTSVSNIEVGDSIGIRGALGGDTNQETTVNGALAIDAVTIPINASNSNFPSSGFIYIGTEIIEYTGRDGSNFTGATRGALGTTASTHSDTDNVQIVLRLNGLVDSISGSDVTLRDADLAATNTVSGAVVQTGQKGVKFQGDLTIDGRLDRAGTLSSINTFGIKGRLASELYVGEDVKLINWDHGGVHISNTYKSHILGKYKGNGVPANSNGADIWLFQSCNENIVSPVSAEDGYTSIILDDRTTGSSDLDGPCSDNVIKIPTVIGYDRACVIAGSSRNYIEIPYASTDKDTFKIVDDQGTTSRVSSENTMSGGVLKSATTYYASIGGTSNKADIKTVSGNVLVEDGNSLVVQPSKVLVKDTTVDFASLASNARGSVDVTVTGASSGTVGGAAGDAVRLEFTDPGMNDATLKGFIIDAWVHSSNTVRVQAFNADTATHDAVSINIRLTVTGAVANLP